MRKFSSSLFGIISLFFVGGSAFCAQPKLEVVKRFPKTFMMIGVAASPDGQVFASAPATVKRYSASVVEVDTKSGALRPFPSASWNEFSLTPQDNDRWVSVPALWVDDTNHLWVLDSSLPQLDQKVFPPKLVKFEPKTGKVVRKYVFDHTIVPSDSLNDVRIDNKHGYAYITNESGRGGLVVLNLKSGAYRLVLANRPSGVADTSQHLHIYGRVALKLDGSVPVTQADGIALSPDREWLYYRPLTDHNYWRIPTQALRDETLSADQLQDKVQFMGRSVMSGGMIMDAKGRLWVGDIEHHALYALKISHDGKIVASKKVYDQPKILDWADGFAIANNWLYISDSRLDELVFKNGHKLNGLTTIYKMQLPNKIFN